MNKNPIAVCFYITDNPNLLPYWSGWLVYGSDNFTITYCMEKGYPKQFAYAEGDREQILKEAGIK